MKYLTNKIIFLPILIALLFLVIFVSKPMSKPMSKPSNITEQQAINTVKNLPEVKQLLNYKDSFVRIDERPDKNYFYIQTGTINYTGKVGTVSDSHTATSNWYKVSVKTGKIACSMMAYDQQGKFIGSGETKSICIQVKT